MNSTCTENRSFRLRQDTCKWYPDVSLFGEQSALPANLFVACSKSANSNSAGLKSRKYVSDRQWALVNMLFVALASWVSALFATALASPVARTHIHECGVQVLFHCYPLIINGFHALYSILAAFHCTQWNQNYYHLIFFSTSAAILSVTCDTPQSEPLPDNSPVSRRVRPCHIAV